jgi:predicted Holliday junction resolvase-like endonuclease
MTYIFNIVLFAAYAYAAYTLHIQTLRKIKLQKRIDALLFEKEENFTKIEDFQKEIKSMKLLVQKIESDHKIQIHENYEMKLENSSLLNRIEVAQTELHNEKKFHQTEIKKVQKETRTDALKRSRSILRGQASEHLAPYVVKGTNPKDYRFMGNPIDYICFDGLSDIIDGVSSEMNSVRFIDIKTGKSSLNKSQRRIRDAILASKVTFEVINLDENIDNEKK